MERAYTVKEIDALRGVVSNKYLYGRYSGSQSMSRSYKETDKAAVVEEQVRTWMMAGMTAADLLASEAS